jgi:hypothetical protein
MSTYQPVPFNEGAPLDPSLLMQLQNNVTEAYTKAIALSNSTKNTEYSIKSDCGKEKIEGMGKNTTGSKTVTVTGFSSKAIVVATPALNDRPKEQITITIKSTSDGQFVVNAVSSDPDRKELWVNWHISERDIYNR